MEYEIMACSLDGRLVPTGETFACDNALEFVEHIAAGQPMLGCATTEHDQVIDRIARNLASSPFGAISLTITGSDTLERAQSFMREFVRVGLARELA